jgi:hypothetical protein
MIPGRGGLSQTLKIILKVFKKRIAFMNLDYQRRGSWD